jgi:exonuclease VII large subunit
VTQLAARFTQIIAHNTAAMEEITNKYAELATRLEGAPDFRQWATMLTELNQRVQTLEITMKSAVETLNQIAENFNKAVETLNAYQKTITDAIVGRLQQYIDNAVANLLNEISQRLQPQAFTEQQAQTIAQLVVDLLIKRKVAR